MKRLLMLGGGHAHALALLDFAREHLPGVQAMLVTPFPRGLYSGMLPGLVAGRYARADCELPLQALAQRAQVSFCQASAVALDANARTVQLSDGRTASYDALSIDIGGTAPRDAIPGARAHALFLRPVEHFTTLLDGVFRLASDRVLDVVVVGAGAAGVELVLALAQRLGRPGQEAARLCLVAGTDGVLARYPERARAAALAMLRRARVTVFNERCVEVTAQHVVLANGARLACHAPIMALPVQAPAWLASSGLALDDEGLVRTAATLQSVSHADVFAAGDVASRAESGLPRSGVYAVRAGPALALNLRRHLAGGELQPWRSSPRSLNLLALGGGRAVASWGGWAAQGRWAWAWKDRIDRGFIARFAAKT